jgi:anti-sigma B factor antagonist
MTTRREARERRIGTVRIDHLGERVAAINLEGDCDMATAPLVEGHVARLLDEHKRLIINLSDATFIDSSIVRALFDADAAARRNGHVVVLEFGTTAVVERVLAITSMDKHLLTAKTRAEALVLLESHGPGLVSAATVG